MRKEKLHIGDEMDNLRTDLVLLDQVLHGLQAIADSSEMDPEDFEPGILFMVRLFERVEKMEKALEEAASQSAPASVRPVPRRKAA